MNTRKIKQLASRVYNVSPKRVHLDVSQEQNREVIKNALRRDDIQALVKDKVITIKQKKGTSRARARHIAAQKEKGRRQGIGSRKGTANARRSTKEVWMVKIRALRKLLKDMRKKEMIPLSVYRQLYLRAKGNMFRNKKHMVLYIKQNRLFNAENGKKQE